MANYQKPEIQIIFLECESVLTASGNVDLKDGVGMEWIWEDELR